MVREVLKKLLKERGFATIVEGHDEDESAALSSPPPPGNEAGGVTDDDDDDDGHRTAGDRQHEARNTTTTAFVPPVAPRARFVPSSRGIRVRDCCRGRQVCAVTDGPDVAGGH